MAQRELDFNGRYVITGGPGAGKTTTLNELRNMGYQIVPEAARMIIEHGWGDPRKDLSAFQKKVVALQLSLEQMVDGFAFCDRGFPDVIAYSRLGNIFPPIISCDRYSGVFLIDPVPFQNDSVRWESKEQARVIHDEIERAYRELNYDIVKVPVLSPKERAEFIVKSLRGAI